MYYLKDILHVLYSLSTPPLVIYFELLSQGSGRAKGGVPIVVYTFVIFFNTLGVQLGIGIVRPYSYMSKSTIPRPQYLRLY
jgi:hypothetical protein